jgi:hypothetical protein
MLSFIFKSTGRPEPVEADNLRFVQWGDVIVIAGILLDCHGGAGIIIVKLQ